MMSVRLCNNNCNDRDGNDGVDGTEGQAKMSKDGNNMFLDAERTDLNRALTSMNKQKGDVTVAADTRHKLNLETYASLPKEQKLEFILKQLWSRLTLATRDHAQNCKNYKALVEEGTESYMTQLSEFMTEHHSQGKDAYELSKHYHTIYLTQTRMIHNSEEGSKREETKDSGDTHNEEKWMSALRATVLFLALSPHTPEQNHTLRHISTDANLDKILTCRDIVNILLQKHARNYHPSHQSKIESWGSYHTTTTVMTSTSTIMSDPDPVVMIEANSSEDDKHNQYSFESNDGFSGGMIARIGQKIQEPTQPKTPHKEERNEDDQKEELESEENEKGSTKSKILMNEGTGDLGGKKRIRHQSSPSIPSLFDNTRIIHSPSCPILCNDNGISSSQHIVHLQTGSAPIVEDVNNDVDNFIDTDHYQLHEHASSGIYESARPVVPYSGEESPTLHQSQRLTSNPNIPKTTPLRSPQQSLWLENATLYEKNGNYAKSLYYYDLYLTQLREITKSFHHEHNKALSSDCADEETQTSEHNIRITVSHAIEMAWLLHKVGVVRWKTGEYDKSLSPLLEASSSLRCFYVSSLCDSDKKIYGVGLVEILNSVGKLYVSRGECDQARSFLDESYGILKTVCTQSVPDVAHGRTDKCKKLAGQTKNQYVEGSDILEPLEVMQKESNVNADGIIMHPAMAQTIITIGMIDDIQGKYSEALQKFKMGYYIQSRILCPNHVDIAATLNVIGITNGKMTHYNKAMKYHKKALKIYTQQFGNDHVDVAVTQNNIGQIYYLLGDFTKSMVAFTESLRVMKVALGRSHRNVAASLYNIALIHLAWGKLDEALLLLKDVYKSQRKALGSDHVDVALTLESIGDAYERKGRLDRGIQLYEKALRIRISAFGKSHLHVAFTLDRIGKALKSHGKYLKEAMRRFHEALNVYHLNGLLNEDERVILARTNLEKIRDTLELKPKRAII